MPSYDFAVDIQALADAAIGMNDTLKLFKDKDVEDLIPSEDDLGSEVVWDAVDEFEGRWEEGMNNLCHDVEEMAGRLGKIAMNYGELIKFSKEKLGPFATSLADLKLLDDE